MSIFTVDKTSSQELGFLAENIAARYLESCRYAILERNYRQPWGEIDIVASLGETLVFVEVKANRQEFLGNFNPEQRVNANKLKKITRTAMLYLEHERQTNLDTDWQIDIISVTFDAANQCARLKHFKNIGQAYN